MTSESWRCNEIEHIGCVYNRISKKGQELIAVERRKATTALRQGSAEKVTLYGYVGQKGLYPC